MGIKRFLATVATAGALSLGAFSAQAATICNGCDYVDAAAATYLGVHNGTTNDLSTFQNIFPGLISTAFSNFWVFDIAPTSDGSGSADFTVLAAIAGFTGALWTDAGSVCGGGPGTGCASVAVGAVVAGDSDPSAERIGQINFEATRVVPEPGTLALMGLALAGLGFLRRRA